SPAAILGSPWLLALSAADGAPPVPLTTARTAALPVAAFSQMECDAAIAHRLPVIASVRYGAGELTSAAVPATSGHLIVVTGLDGADALVNDPAAPTAATVPRRYKISELSRVWLERTGVGY